MIAQTNFWVKEQLPVLTPTPTPTPKPTSTRDPPVAEEPSRSGVGAADTATKRGRTAKSVNFIVIG